ncbi:MAG: Glutathione transport system permease protein GsiD [Sodalis sp.]|nr:MAG: Glutathione transport system permease protein GsiD [Sodalis sp.]
MLLCDSLMLIPMILFALAVVMLAGSSLATIVLIIITFMVLGYFRVVRSQTRVLKRIEYIIPGHGHVAGPRRLRYPISNLTGMLLVIVAMDIPAVIAIELGLRFLEQGIQPPNASSGTMTQR